MAHLTHPGPQSRQFGNGSAAIKTQLVELNQFSDINAPVSALKQRKGFGRGSVSAAKKWGHKKSIYDSSIW
jgi:hypothetical protein